MNVHSTQVHQAMHNTGADTVIADLLSLRL